MKAIVWKTITFSIIAFMLGLLVGTITPVNAEVIQNTDDIGDYFLFYDRILPPQMITVLENTNGVINVIVNEQDKTTQIYYNANQFTITKEEMLRYLKALDEKMIMLEIQQTFFIGYEIPDGCHTDYLNKSKVWSEYNVNGEDYYIDDGKCKEIKRSYRE